MLKITKEEVEQRAKELENKPVNEQLNLIKTLWSSFSRDTRITIFALEILVDRQRRSLSEINRNIHKYYWNTDSEV